MAQPVIQQSFNSGEWSPALNARVDLAKYHSGAALLRNFFVDYRGGASTRTGTKYILQAYKSATPVRLIAFQASFDVTYVLEFGDQYIRFYTDGGVVLEATKAITGITQANPAVVTSAGHGYSTGQWIFVTGVVGMTQVNGKYFQVTVLGVNTFSLQDLNGVNIDSTGYTAYSSGGTAARVYTLPSPYMAADLSLLKFSQNVNTMELTHPNYVPYTLTLISATNWTLLPNVFGASISPPSAPSVATTLGAGSVNYAYVVTTVDNSGQESGPSTFATLASKLDLRTTAGTNTISWTAVSGAQYYNVYKAQLSYAGAVPAGTQFGFIGFATGTSFIDSNIDPNFSETPPIPQNPFQGAGVASIAITAPGAYTSVPTVTIAAAPTGGQTATASAILQVQGTPTVSISINQSGNIPGDILDFGNGVRAVVATVNGSFQVLTFQPITYPGSSSGAISSGSVPSNPILGTNQRTHTQTTADFVWGVGILQLISPGAGYTSTPGITFSSGAATATATLGPASNGNPSVSTYTQQRLMLAGPPGNVQQFNLSKPGSYFNFDISNPIQPDDAISGTISSLQLNTIKALVPMSSGVLIFGDRQIFLLNGGSPGAPVTPSDISTLPQAYVGANDVPPIVVNYDALYVQAKGSIVRDITYNFYTNIYTGTDITVLSSHLFYGFNIEGWTYAEEPFKIVWAVRSDGVLLSLTFLKEQELIAWAHSDTNGSFKSVTSITEQVSGVSVDAVYVVVERTINGNTVKYIERFAERSFPGGVVDAWCVDAGLQYNGAPATNFSGGEHLAGATVTGLADGVIIPPFTMPTSGNFTLPAASKVTVGLAFTPQLQTLQLDTGEPTIQGKRKKIPAVTLRCEDTLGLSIGTTFANLVPMKDLIVGNLGSMTNEIVTDLVTGDARTIVDPDYNVPGQYCIQQSNPFPATILGVIPEIAIGDQNASKRGAS